MTVGGVAGWYRQTLDGSFSSVSRPIFASKYSFFSIFRDLQDLHTFAPLQIQNFSKFSSTFFSRIFQEILEFLSLESEIRNFSDWILRIFVGISRNLSEFSKIIGNLRKFVKFSEIFQKKVGRYAQIWPPLPSWVNRRDLYRSGKET